jgi:HSF-type DNA-binding
MSTFFHIQDLDMTFEPLLDEDNDALMQFFEDSNAWEPPADPASVSSVPLLRSNQEVTSEYKCRQRMSSNKAKSSSSVRPRRKVGRPSAFPQKLYRMLMEIHLNLHGSSLRDIIGFVPDGSGFVIHDTEAFVKQVLPQYFKMSSFSSFQRQLQLYNFKRLRNGGPYCHPLFHRDQSEKVDKMVRKQPQNSSYFNNVAAVSA